MFKTNGKRPNWKQRAEYLENALREETKLLEELRRDFDVVVKKQLEFKNNFHEARKANDEMQNKLGQMSGERRLLADEVKWLKSVVNVLRDALASQIERQEDD